MELTEFFMVFVEGQSQPVYKHHSLKSAETEAKRLAELTKLRAYVLTTVKSYELDLFKEKNCIPSELDLPF